MHRLIMTMLLCGSINLVAMNPQPSAQELLETKLIAWQRDIDGLKWEYLTIWEDICTLVKEHNTIDINVVISSNKSPLTLLGAAMKMYLMRKDYDTRQAVLDFLEYLLKKRRANPNILLGKKQITPLHMAVKEGKDEVVKILLENGADHSAPIAGKTLMQFAQECYDNKENKNESALAAALCISEIKKFIPSLPTNTPVQYTDEQLAVLKKYRTQSIEQELIMHRIGSNYNSGFWDTHIRHLLLENKTFFIRDDELIYDTILWKDLEVLNKLFTMPDADFNKSIRGQTPVCLAAKVGWPDGVKALLQKNVHVTQKDIDAVDMLIKTQKDNPFHPGDKTLIQNCESCNYLLKNALKQQQPTQKKLDPSIPHVPRDKPVITDDNSSQKLRVTPPNITPALSTHNPLFIVGIIGVTGIACWAAYTWYTGKSVKEKNVASDSTSNKNNSSATKKISNHP
jgi:ankyrin repeat protein